MEGNNNQENRDILTELIGKNKTCFDCQEEKEIKVVSLNNGVFLCDDCGKNHSELLEESLSRPIRLDQKLSWTEQELHYLILGGNSNISEYYQQYNLPLDIDIELKYKTKCSHYYRYQLDSLVHHDDNHCPLQPLQLGDALDIIEAYQFYQIVQQDNPSIAADNQSKADTDLLYEGLQIVNKNIQSAFKQTQVIYNSPKTQEVISTGKEIGSKVISNTKQVIQHPTTQHIIQESKVKLEAINQTIQQTAIYDKAKGGIGYLSQKGKHIYQSEGTQNMVNKINDNQYVQQAKGGLFSGISWMSNKITGKSEQQSQKQEVHQDPLIKDMNDEKDKQ